MRGLGAITVFSSDLIIDALLLCREHTPEHVAQAVAGALTAGAHDGRAIALLARRAERTTPTPAPLELDARLARHDRPAPVLTDYDQLLAHGGTR